MTFKDTTGNWITQGLFLETSSWDQRGFAIYTFCGHDKENRGKTYLDFGSRYVEICDPTEYEVATKLLGGWDHWQRILANKQLREYIEKYRAELEVKLRSQAIKGIIEATYEGSKGVAAAKWLADKGWVKRSPGAPSKQEKERQLKIDQQLSDRVQSDLERIRH